MFRIIITLLLMTYSMIMYGQDLIPYNDGKLWGYCDTNANVVIAPTWKAANFFHGNRAAVTVALPDGQISHCIIDRQGDYIVPPEYHWNGEWKGWGYTELNAHRDGVSYGLIDTGGHVLVPFEYQFPRQSPYSDRNDFFPFLNVQKKGKLGAVAPDGRLTVACEWDKIWYTGNDSTNGYFVVTRNKRTGLLDVQGRAVLPPRYTFMYPAGSKAFVVFNTDPATDKTLYGTIAMPSCKQVLRLEYDEIRFVTDDLFIVQKKGEQAVYSGRGKRLLGYTKNEYEPFYSPSRHYEGLASADTLIEYRADTSTVRNRGKIFRYVNTHTFKPIADWQLPYNNRRSFTDYIPPDLYNHYPPQVKVNGVDTTRFMLDSIEWHTEYYIDLPKPFYSINGNTPLIGTPVTTLIDRELKYLFTPIKQEIVFVNYDPATGLLIYQQGYPMKYGVMDTSGNVVTPLQSNPIVQTLKIGKRIYAVSLTSLDNTEYLSYPYEGQMRWLLHATGKPVLKLAAYTIPGQRYNVSFFENKYFRVQNKKGMQGFVDINGKILFPKISFKYRFALPLVVGRFVLGSGEDDRRRRIVDQAGKDRMPAIRVSDVFRPIAHKLFPADPVTLDDVPTQLLRIDYQLSDRGSQGYFYMSPSGKIYTSGFELGSFGY